MNNEKRKAIDAGLYTARGLAADIRRSIEYNKDASVCAVLDAALEAVGAMESRLDNMLFAEMTAEREAAK